MKRVKTFNQYVNESLNEGSYEDFISSWGSKIKKHLATLEKISKDAASGKIAEKKIDKAMDFIAGIYDEVNYTIVEEIIYGGQRHDIREVAQRAIDMQNRYGTEMSMVYYCMDDFINNVKRGR